MPIVDDNSLASRYIRAIENPDSIGYRDGKWFASPRKWDDSNNRGFGVDIAYNSKAKKLTNNRVPSRWLTEEEERNLRNGYIGDMEKVLDKWTPKMLAQEPSEAKKAMAIGMLYRGDGIKNVIKRNSPIRDAYFSGSDYDMQKAVSDYYKSKRLNERAKQHDSFMKEAIVPPIMSQYNWGLEDSLPNLPPYKGDGGQLRKDWNSLSQAEKSNVIKLAVQNGITDLDTIKGAYNEFAEGGKIHIKPENRGKFTALKKRTGHSATWFKEHGTPAQKKMATFALNARHWKHEDGGNLFAEGGAGENSYNNKKLSILDRLSHGISRTMMELGRTGSFPSRHNNLNIAQETYLMPRELQQNIFESHGYKKTNEDYGLVKKAVGDRNIPIYQRNPDSISRDRLIPIDNFYNGEWFGNAETDLIHAGSFPSAVYTDTEGNLYQKAWDLNDYGDHGRDGTKYGWFRQKVANAVDVIGSPVVVTTGFQPVEDDFGRPASLAAPPRSLRSTVDSFLRNKGLERYDGTFEIGPNGKVIDYPAFIGLPEVTITAERSKKAKGGSY